MFKKAASSFALSICFALVGCQQPTGGMEGHDGPPPRAAELDRLDQFVGNWTADCEMKMDGKTSTCKGTSTSEWDLDKTVMVNRMEFDMGEMGKMKGMEVMTWDAGAGKYRTYWFDSMGGLTEGSMRFDEKSSTWISKGSGRDPMSGETRLNSGTMKVAADGSHEWTFKETDAWGFKTTMEIKGTSRRQ